MNRQSGRTRPSTWTTSAAPQPLSCRWRHPLRPAGACVWSQSICRAASRRERSPEHQSRPDPTPAESALRVVSETPSSGFRTSEPVIPLAMAVPRHPHACASTTSTSGRLEQSRPPDDVRLPTSVSVVDRLADVSWPHSVGGYAPVVGLPRPPVHPRCRPRRVGRRGRAHRDRRARGRLGVRACRAARAAGRRSPGSRTPLPRGRAAAALLVVRWASRGRGCGGGRGPCGAGCAAPTCSDRLAR